MRKQILKGNSPDGHPYVIIREQNFKLNILVKFWVYIFSQVNRHIIIYGECFYKEDVAVTFVNSFNYLEQIQQHVPTINLDTL